MKKRREVGNYLWLRHDASRSERARAACQYDVYVAQLLAVDLQREHHQRGVHCNNVDSGNVWLRLDDLCDSLAKLAECVRSLKLGNDLARIGEVYVLLSAKTHLWHICSVLGEARHEAREHAANLHRRLHLRADGEQRLQRLQVELVGKHLWAAEDELTAAA